MKLSPKQKEVIRLMREGWELGESSRTNNILIQQGGCGKGGKSKVVNVSTFRSLLHRRLIGSKQLEWPYNFDTYALTDLGKTIEI